MPMERNENGENRWRRWGGKPPHFARLRRRWEGTGGSRGEMRRMRARPVVPVGLAWRWGRDSRPKLANILAVERETVL